MVLRLWVTTPYCSGLSLLPACWNTNDHGPGCNHPLLFGTVSPTGPLLLRAESYPV